MAKLTIWLLLFALSGILSAENPKNIRRVDDRVVVKGK